MKILVSVLIFLPLIASARWMKIEESEVAISEKLQIKLNKDFTAEYHYVERVKIQNETGRSDWGTRHLKYSPKNSKLQIKRASTFTLGKEYKVSPSDIVDTEINATESGFDESREILVPFSHVEIGSEIEVETFEKVFRPSYENQFSDRFYIGAYYLLNHWDLEIVSEVPLFFEFNDADHLLDFSQAAKDNKFIYNVRLKKPNIQRTIDENRSHDDEKKLTWFQVSNNLTAVEILNQVVKKYEKILAEPLPSQFKDLLESARREKNQIAQINLVLAGVSEKLRYMGDWRAIDGGHVPRSLATIAETHFGDCKDLSALTTKILRELGYNANVAWTNRGKFPPYVNEFGYLIFNHAIVNVKLENKELWLDPTNAVAFAEGVFEDIAERKAAVLDPKKPEFREIKFTQSSNNREITTSITEIKPERTKFEEVSLSDFGSMTLGSAGLGLRISKEQIERFILEQFTNSSQVKWYKFADFNFNNRIAKPYEIKVSYEANLNLTDTSFGPGLPFAPPTFVSDLLSIDIPNRKSDFVLAPPEEVLDVYQLKNVKGKGHNLKDCSAKSIWADYNFRISKALDRVTREFILKKYTISAGDIASPEFARFIADLRVCGQTKYLILNMPK